MKEALLFIWILAYFAFWALVIGAVGLFCIHYIFG